MNKKGASLVELIAVIVIMGIIAGIGTATTVAIIRRQRQNTRVNALNDIYSTAKSLLVLVETGNYDENVTVEENVCYISLTTLIETGNVADGENYKPIGNEIYFCYNYNKNFVIISNAEPTGVIPASTGIATVDEVEVTYSFTSNRFVIA